ncbi:MAG: DUF1801 domain-containing protein [Chloroflexi bacterium]|nr:DUF1801 domain-containing protein [Chloroflexota bacterium]
MSSEVDAFVQEKVLPQFHGVVAAIRALMTDAAPDATEYITYGIPAWRMTRIIAVLSPTKKDITLAFSNGADFEDTFGLLKGVGNRSKHVKLKTADEVIAHDAALRDYIAQAIAHDTR